MSAGHEPLPSPTQPIAIVGMACMFPKAPGLHAYWHVVRAGVDCITSVPATHWSAEAYFDSDPKSPDRTYCRRGGFLSPLRFDPTEFSLPPNTLEATDTSQILSLVVAKAALEDAGYGEGRTFNRETTSVIMGVTGCLELVIPLGARLGHPIWRKALRESGVADATAEEVVRRISSAYVPWQENSFPGLLGNVVAGRVANRLNLQGTNCVVDAACASSHSAAHLATMELASGRADMVVTGGVDTFNDIFMYMCFSKTPALSPSEEIRPFDHRSDGTLLGEGIGLVVLKRLQDAERDGDRIYAVIRAIGTSSDGEGQAIYAPASAGQTKALRNAYRIAGVSPATVELVEAHGTGTKVGDMVEFEALRSVYSEAHGEHQWCALTSVKSQIGHTKAAAGSAGLIKTALALYHKVLPPTLKIEQPNPRMRIEESPFYLNCTSRPWMPRPEHPRRAGLSSFGFGGSNFHMVLEEHRPARPEVAWDGSVQIAAFATDSRVTLVEAVEQALLEVQRDPQTWSRLAASSRERFDEERPYRVTLVASPEEAEATLQDALRAARGEQAGAGVFYGEGRVAGAVAFIFPGQGSQYVGMGRELACVFPEMLEAWSEADLCCGTRLSALMAPLPAFDEETAKQQTAALTRTECAQPALGAVELGMLRILRRFGLLPDMACGHSYGELAALHAAGVMDAPTLLKLSRLRGVLMAGDGADRGTMLAVMAPVEEVRKLLEQQADPSLVLANLNAPRQAVVSGPRDAIGRLAAACKKARMPAKPLPVAAAFHSPLVADACTPFRTALEAAVLEAPEVPVLANATAAPYPTHLESLRDMLGSQLVQPVDFVGDIEGLYDAGARIFVEVGPRTVLSGLVRSILADRSHLAVSLDASAGSGSGLVDLARGLAQCAAAGLPVRLAAWEITPPPPRKMKMEVSIVGSNYRSSSTPASVPTPPARPQATAAEIASTPPPPPAAPPAAPPAPAPDRPAAPDASQALAPASPAAPAAPPAQAHLLVEAFRSVQGSLAAMQAMQQQTAAAHQRFLETQDSAHRVFLQVVAGQQQLMGSMLGGGPPVLTSYTPPVASPPALLPPSAPQIPVVPAPMLSSPPPPASVAATRPAPVAIPQSALPLAPAIAPPPPPRPVQASVPSPPPAASAVAATGPVVWRPAPSGGNGAGVHTSSVNGSASHRNGTAPTAPPPTTESIGPGAAAVEQVILKLVAEKTGYPVEMLNLGMDLEADLGIDSIKRVEILAGVEEALPDAPRVETERMGSLRTLRQVLEALSQAPAPPPSAPSAPASTPQAEPTGSAAEALMAVVADKTGYPREMLTLDMDMEADLGIDSIKRVEILAAMEERMPDAPKVDTSAMGSLRTLRQVVEALRQPVGAGEKKN